MRADSLLSADNVTRIAGGGGLSATVQPGGCLEWLSFGEIMLNLYPATALEPGLTGLFLRRFGAEGDTPEAIPLLGSQYVSGVAKSDAEVVVTGAWADLRYTATLHLCGSAPVWFWHVDVCTVGPVAATVDVIYTQDVGLAPFATLRSNEYYASQYLDLTPIAHKKYGVSVAVRQNMGREYHPWVLLGSLGQTVGWSTDARQFFGLSARSGDVPIGLLEGLPSTRLQHEHTLVGLAQRRLTVEPNTTARAADFFGYFAADHPEASSDEDAAVLDVVAALATDEQHAKSDGSHVPAGAAPVARSLYADPRLFTAMDPSDEQLASWCGVDRRHAEIRDGQTWSFFDASGGHVVTRAKDLAVLRPHGHILATGGDLLPAEAAMTSTVWMEGVFASQVTQGHVSRNRLLSGVRTYLGLQRAAGLRIFVESGGADDAGRGCSSWQLLAEPSAFRMTPDSATWWYSGPDCDVEVTSRAGIAHRLDTEVRVIRGGALRLLAVAHVQVNGDGVDGALDVTELDDSVVIKPSEGTPLHERFPAGSFEMQWVGAKAEVTDDRVLFADGISRNQPVVALVCEPTEQLQFTLTAMLVSNSAQAGDTCEQLGRVQALGQALRIESPSGFMQVIADIVPWFIHNALVHYLTPRGLEQFTSGGWGTRDVCQGPVELLFALDRADLVRGLLLQVFAAQAPSGDWPQSFGIFDRDANERHTQSHGDVIFWPLLALGQYLTRTGDASILSEEVPFYTGPDELVCMAPIEDHVSAAMGLVNERVVPGTRLTAYGHGDWNDSLQPADDASREAMSSAWTVTLHYQVLHTLAAGLRRAGLGDRGPALLAQAGQILAEFQQHLIADGVLAGFGDFRDPAEPRLLIHPRDTITGLTYSGLPMIHAMLTSMLTPAQSEAHWALLAGPLQGPDGVRLFDRPAAYRGGPSKVFLRAESSSFFGREIGLMYQHAHLRYIEALAFHGRVGEFIAALGKAIAIGMCDRVAPAMPRQANCYYSSSDGVFADRYDAASRYGELLAGNVPLEGGWRVYSSGPGIALRLVVESLLGVRRAVAGVEFDPVMPVELDGLRVELPILGRAVTVVYRVGAGGCGVSSVTCEGQALVVSTLDNAYRAPGVWIEAEVLLEALDQGSTLVIEVGGQK